MTLRTINWIFVALMLVPLFAFADDPAFQKNGIFGCNRSGADSTSVGVWSAIGGAFVPVNDAAVTLNTGYLVYKECVLRGLVDRMRENQSAGIQKDVIRAYTAGRDGKPYFSQNLALESGAVFDKSVENAMYGSTLSTVHPAFRDSVKRTITRSYLSMRFSRNKALACSYTGDLASLERTPTKSFSWLGLDALSDTDCIPFFATIDANDLVMADAASAWHDRLTQLNWYDGNYPTEVLDADGNAIVVTPGSIILSNTQQALQTGFRQLENANDIDQMVGQLFSGITAKVVSDNQGLIGLTKSTGSTPSYLDQIVSGTTQGVRDGATFAGLSILGPAKQSETDYLAVMNDLKTFFASKESALRTEEAQCFAAIINKVCTSAPGADKKCNSSGGTLTVATSTIFSQPIIDLRITPNKTVVDSNIAASQARITALNAIIADLSSTASSATQLAALAKLDAEVARKPLRSSSEVQKAIDDKTRAVNDLEGLVSDVIKNWKGKGDSANPTDVGWDGASTNPAVGWCNVDNQTTIDAWIRNWK